MSSKSWKSAVFAGALALLFGLAPTPASAQLTNLNAFPAGTANEALGINASGQVVGDATGGDGEFRAFLQAPTTVDGQGNTVVGTMYNLGTLPGFIGAVATGINDIGQVCGYSYDATYNSHAFLWTPDVPNGFSSTTGMVDLGGLTTTPGSVSAAAYGMNNAGRVVGGSYTDGDVLHAFLWTPDTANGTTGSMTDLGTVLGDLISAAFGINNLDEVTGWSTATNAGVYQSYTWHPAPIGGAGAFHGDTVLACGGDEPARIAMDRVALAAFTGPRLGSMTAHPALPGKPNAEGYDINDAGQVVGQSYFIDLETFDASGAPVLWGSTGSSLDLSPYTGGENGVANAINESGQIVGWTGVVDPETLSETPRAFLWTPMEPNSGTSGVAVDLGTLGGTSSMAMDISDEGLVTGTSSIDSEEDRPFLIVNSVRAVGFDQPASELVLFGKPFTQAIKAHNRPRDIPLKFEMFSGDTRLTGATGGVAPRIIAMSCNGLQVNLALAGAAGSSNGGTLNFRPAGTKWIHDFKTTLLPLGSYTVMVQLPDGSMWSSRFLLR